MGIKLDILKNVKIEATTLKVHCKVVDDFTARLTDQEGETICDQESDYVPSFMPGDHFGDYLILDIDIATGQITNWKPPKASDLKAWIDKCNGVGE